MMEGLKGYASMVPLVMAAACRPSPEQIALTHLTEVVERAHNDCGLAVQTPAHLVGESDEKEAKTVLLSNHPYVFGAAVPDGFNADENCLNQIRAQAPLTEAGCDVKLFQGVEPNSDSVIGFRLEASTDCTASTVRDAKLAATEDQE